MTELQLQFALLVDDLKKCARSQNLNTKKRVRRSGYGAFFLKSLVWKSHVHLGSNFSLKCRVFTRNKSTVTSYSFFFLCSIVRVDETMQHLLDLSGLHGPPCAQRDRSHRFRSFMIEEILTDPPGHKLSSPTGGTLRFGLQALLSTRPYHNDFALKADQTGLFKLPLCPLSCSLGTPLESALLSRPPGLQDSSGSRYLALESHLHGKTNPRLDRENKTKKGRRSRTVFTELQLVGLEKRFEKQKYLSTPDRIDLAESLGLSQLQVKTWYQNRRMKWKKIVLQGGGLESPTKPKGRPKKNSIPSSEQLSDGESARDKNPESDGQKEYNVNH